jgi:hypothetical protein
MLLSATQPVACARTCWFSVRMSVYGMEVSGADLDLGKSCGGRRAPEQRNDGRESGRRSSDKSHGAW